MKQPGRTTPFLSWPMVAAMGLAAATASADQTRTFEADVRPILKAHCFHCHGEEGKTEGNLDVRLVRLLVAGGDSGAALAAGKAGDSYLIERLESGEMPPGETKLSSAELRVIREWIDQGARTARPEPANADQLAFTRRRAGVLVVSTGCRPAGSQGQICGSSPNPGGCVCPGAA